jgi:hypothetical protein
MKYIFIIFAIAILSSCADTTQLTKSGNESFKLATENRIYVSVPTDGRYGNKIYSGSGANVSHIITSSFSKYAPGIESGYKFQTHEQALAYAKKNNIDFLILPTILEWEDRATEWSGKPDRVSIKIAVIHVGSGKTLSSAIIKGKSGLSTLGGDHPQDLLTEPIDEYAKSMY